MAVYDEKVIDHPFKSSIWKRLRDAVISLWILSGEDANDYLDYLNNIDASGKMGFTMQTENENGFEFLDLGFKLKGCNKITVDVLSKCMNRLHSSTFAYSGKICYHFGNTNNWNKILEGIALRLRCFCDADVKFEKKNLMNTKITLLPGITPNHL